MSLLRSARTELSTGFISVLRTSLNSSIVYVHRNEAHYTYISVYYTIINIFEADNIYKKPHQMSSPIFFAIFISLFESTHDSADCWSAHDATRHQLLATASNVCNTDAWPGQKSGLPVLVTK